VFKKKKNTWKLISKKGEKWLKTGFSVKIKEFYDEAGIVLGL